MKTNVWLRSLFRPLSTYTVSDEKGSWLEHCWFQALYASSHECCCCFLLRLAGKFCPTKTYSYQAARALLYEIISTIHSQRQKQHFQTVIRSISHKWHSEGSAGWNVLKLCLEFCTFSSKPRSSKGLNESGNARFSTVDMYL